MGANKSSQITKVSSVGKWVPVHNEEWDGDIPLSMGKAGPSGSSDSQEGEVVFRANTLPWRSGQYEVQFSIRAASHLLTFISAKIRYHHDGKYNVMSLAGPIEIYGKYFSSTIPSWSSLLTSRVPN